jgi:pyridoxamine 5'-phosphate oxidase family protein
MFSEAETNYLKSQRLARIATASAKGTPEVSPVGFEFDGKHFWIGSHSQEIFSRTRRYRNIISGNRRVSIVIDDLASVDPWRPRGIKLSGTAEVMEHDGMFGPGKYIRITPRVTVSWGIDPPAEGRWAATKKWDNTE